MENWQKQHIIRNKYELTRNTIVSEQLLLILESENIFDLSDLDSIRSKQERLEKSSALYDLIQTRVDAYMVLLHALLECKQTGAFQLLVECITNDTLRNANVTFIEESIRLQDVFDDQDFLSICSYLKKTHMINEYQTLLNNISPNFDLVKDTIPKSPPCYITRRVEKRTKVDPRLFKINCKDIFVFQGLEFTELHNIALEPPGKSGRQLMKINTRFISLEFDEHWEILRRVSVKQKTPIHWIVYNASLNTYMLKATKGVSKVLRQFLMPLVDCEIDQSSLLSEDEFITKCLSYSAVCICDKPGMGKSYILTKIAKRIPKEKNKIVAFIPFKSFCKFVKAKSSTVICKHWNERQYLLSFLSTNVLSYAILVQLNYKYEIKLDLFFDGFDEVEDVTWATKFLSGLRNDRNCRIFVTSRFHMQEHLEDALDVLSFNLLPFNEQDQIKYIVDILMLRFGLLEKEKLIEFAKLCLIKFHEKMANAETCFTGIPLQCYLLADVYADQARTYSITSQGFVLSEQVLIDSQFDVFKSYVEQRFPEKADTNIRKDVQSFHAWHSFKILFPKLSQFYYDLCGLSSKDYSKYLGYGLLEEFHNGQNFDYKFLHVTIAEYLVAAVIGDFVIKGFDNPNDTIVVSLLNSCLKKYLKL